MRYKTRNNLAKATKLIMAKGYDQDTAMHLAKHLFSIVKRHDQSVEELIQVLQPRKINEEI